MPLERVRVLPNERLDAVDYQRTNDKAIQNAGLILGNFSTYPGYVVRGGTVSPTAPESMAVELGPTVGLSAAYEIIILENPKNLAIGPAHPSLPRIDLVSIGYSEEEVQPETRKFRDPNPPNDVSDAAIETIIRSVPVPLVTQGIAAPSPVAPALPPGHIPLAYVTVQAGAASISFEDIERAETGRVDRIRVGLPVPNQELVATPWVSDPVISVFTPAGFITRFIGELLIGGGGDFVVVVTLEDVASGTTVGRATTSIGSNLQQIVVRGVRLGPTTGVRQYRWRIVTIPTAVPVNINGGADGTVAPLIPIEATTL